MTNRQAENTLRAIENRLLDNENVTINISALEAISTAICALGAIKQFRWERDVAISQLEELGLSLGQEVDGVYLTYDKYNELLEYKAMYEDLCK